MYLNLVLEYIPETVYKVARHYSKSKQTIPISFIKVRWFRVCFSGFNRFFFPVVLVVHVPAVSIIGVHPLDGHLSQGYQAAKSAPRSGHWRAQAVRFRQRQTSGQGRTQRFLHLQSILSVSDGSPLSTKIAKNAKYHKKPGKITKLLQRRKNCLLFFCSSS